LRHRPRVLAANTGPAQRHEHYAGWPPACEQNYMTPCARLSPATQATCPPVLSGRPKPLLGRMRRQARGVSSREARRPPPIRPGGQRACPDCSCG
jgi:hypothetical protein